MKKLLAVLLLSVSLAACHGSKGSSAFAVPEEFDTSRQYEIVFWAKNDTNKNQTMVYEQAIADFEALYPNITVTTRMYTDYKKIYNDVITNIATNTTPNVCITYPDHIATYMTGANTVASLDDLFRDEKYGFGGSELLFDGPTESEVVPEFLKEGYVIDHYYAIPYMRSSEALYINKTYVEKLGYTIPDMVSWDWIFEVSRKAAEKNSDGTFKLNGQKVLIPFIYKSTDNMLISMLEQLNAPYSTAAGTVDLFHEDTKNILRTIAENTKAGAFSTFAISGYPANFLNAGQCIFAIDSTAGATWMGSDAPLVDIDKSKIVDFETEVRIIPQYDPEHPKMISQGPSICVFNKQDPQEVLASWLFAQYMLTNQVQIDYAKTEGYVPVTLKAQQDPVYQEYLAGKGSDTDEHYAIKIEASELVIENTANTFTTPVFNGSASLRNAAGQLIEDVTKSVRRKAVVDDAFLEKEFADVTSLYRLDQIEASGAKPDIDTPLPAASKALLGSLVFAWVCIIAYFLKEQYKAYKKG